MNLKVKKLSSIIMLMIMLVSIFSPYSNLSATTVNTSSEVVASEITSETTELEETSEITSETILVDNVEMYNTLIDNEKNETLIVSKEDLLKQPRASYNVEKYPHPTLIIEDFSSRFGQLMYFRVNGDIVFCIEATKNVDGIAYDQSESGSYYSTFSSSLRQQVEYFSAYGVDKYSKTGNKDYLWATQLLIWKAIEPSKYNVEGGTSLQPELDEIKNLVSYHFVLPSFMRATSSDALTHTLKWNGSKYTLTLNDTNNVANYKLAELESTYGDYTVSKSGNSVTISTTNHAAVKKMVSPTYTPYESGSNKFYDGGQDLFQGKADPLPMYMNVEIEPALGSMTVVKTGKELSNTSNKIIHLEGAEFELLDLSGKVVRSGTTNSKGELDVSDLVQGEYFVKEISAPTGYLVAPEQKVVIKPNQKTIVTIVDERATGDLIITKQGENLSSTSSKVENLAGAKFELLDSKGQVVRTGTTDSNGELKFLDLLIGNYLLREVGAPTGYLIAVDKDVTIETGKTTKITILDKKISGKAKLQKIGQDLDDTFESLKNVEFKFYQDTNFDGSYETFVGTYLTDNKGQLTTNDLDYGNYQAVETNAVKDYYADFKQEFKIRKNGEVVTLSNFTEPSFGGDVVLNHKIVAEVELNKQGESFINGDNRFSALKGAEFKVIEDVDANGKLDMLDELYAIAFPNTTQTVVTDSNGKAKFTNLDSGKNYLIFETKAPEGYVLDTTVYSISKDNEHTQVKNVITYKLDINNSVIRGQVELQKVGSKECDKSISKPGQIKDCQTVLKDVEFNIYNDLNENGILDEEEDTEDNIVDTITTNESGVALSKELKYGYYLARESMSLDNYYLNETVFAFKITENGEIVKLNNGVVIENIEKLGKIKITKTGNELGNLNDELVFLQNAEYTIYKRIFNDTELDVNSELESEIDSESSNEVVDNLYEVAVLTTDENGNATSPLLSFGNYYIKETKAPEGYLLDETKYEFTIDNDTYSEVIEFSFEDEVITNDIEITKTDLATGDELEGAKLQVLDSNGTVVEEWISTREVHTFTLEYGDYIIVEEFAPEGYLPLLEGVKFSVTEEGIVQSFKIDNKLITNDIEITKVDVANGDELEGAELVVYDKDGDVFEKWTSTTEAYKFTAPYGEYSICETAAPEGYQRLSQCVKFSVTEDGIVQKFKIENELIPVIQKTGQNSYLFIVFSSLIGLVALKYAINIKKAIR